MNEPPYVYPVLGCPLLRSHEESEFSALGRGMCYTMDGAIEVPRRVLVTLPRRDHDLYWRCGLATLRIPLTRGQHAIIDEEDYPVIAGHSWRAIRPRHTWYAVTDLWENHKARMVYMHRVVLGAAKDTLVDHRDGDGLHNCRSNLRIATATQNGANARRRNDNLTGFRGVVYNPRYGSWSSRIRISGGTKHIGTFPTPEDAARAYDAHAREIFGEFARLNFPEKWEMSG